MFVSGLNGRASRRGASPRALSRRTLLQGATVGTAAALLSSCQRGGESSSSATTDGLVFATFPGHEHVVEPLAAEYTAETEVPITTNVLPRNGYREALTGPLTASSDSFDILVIENTWLAEFADAGWIAPLDELLGAEERASAEADIFETSLAGCQYNDQLWGLPWDESTMLLFYRTDWLDGPPETTEEYLDLALEFTRAHNSNSPTEFGTVLQGSPERVNTQDWYNFFWSSGGELFDSEWNPTFDSEIAVETLTWRYSQRLEHGVVPPDVSTFGYPETMTALQQGQAAFALQWNSAYSTLSDPSESPDVADHIDVAQIPVSTFGTRERIPFKKFWVFCVNAFSKNPEEAARFIHYFTGAEAGKRSLEMGGPTSNRTAWTDPKATAERGDAQVAIAAFESGRVMPTLPEMPAVELELNRALAQVLDGAQTASSALSTAADNARRLLERTGRLG